MTTDGWCDGEATRFTVDDRGVARLTLHRPDSGNSRNQAMRRELARAYDVVETSADVSVLVITGAGERFFCTGMDLKEASSGETPLERAQRLRSSRDIDDLARLTKPTIAAINGYALGGGLEMALACDLRVAAETAAVGLPEVHHGLVPGGGATHRLPRIVGAAHALDLILTGRRVGAAEALRMGLVHEVTSADTLTVRVDEIAGAIAALPTRAVILAKELVLRSATLSPADAGAAELDGLIALLDERDATRAGVSSTDREPDAQAPAQQEEVGA